MSKLSVILSSLVVTLAPLQIEQAVKALAETKDRIFSDYHESVKSGYQSLLDAITSGDSEAVSAASEEFEKLIGVGDTTVAEHSEATDAIVSAVIATPEPERAVETGEADETG